MSKEELKEKVLSLLESASFEEGGEFLNVNVEAAAWKPFAQQLRSNENLLFDFLGFVTCIDWKTHLTVVYEFGSTVFHHNLFVKVKIVADKPEIETISDIWKGAEFHEREVFELFGVNFINHPDLRLLILPDGWEGKNPLRKDFEDAVNMIKL
jgi:NADH-quinone oxidoreductase subunit C